MRLLGREPAQWLQLVSGILIFLTPLLNLRPDINGAILAVVSCIFGLGTAIAVSSEKAAAAVAALIKALIALALAFRFDLPVEMQSGIMILVEAVTAWYLRTQVVAPVLPEPPNPVPAPAAATQSRL
jgi:nicotinamide riboside transporter PnuC